MVCIAALPPGGLSHTRYLAKRLTAKFPHTRLVIGRWGGAATAADDRDQLKDALGGTVNLDVTLGETVQHLDGWRPAFEAAGVRSGEIVPPAVARRNGTLAATDCRG